MSLCCSRDALTVRAMLRPEQAAGEAFSRSSHRRAAGVHLTRTLTAADQLTGSEEQHFVCREGGREGGRRGGLGAARPLHLFQHF